MEELFVLSSKYLNLGNSGGCYLNLNKELTSISYLFILVVGGQQQLGFELSFVSDFSCPYISISFMKMKPLFSSLSLFTPANCKPNLLYIILPVYPKRTCQFYVFKLGNILTIAIRCNLSHLSYRLWNYRDYWLYLFQKKLHHQCQYLSKYITCEFHICKPGVKFISRIQYSTECACFQSQLCEFEVSFFYIGSQPCLQNDALN